MDRFELARLLGAERQVAERVGVASVVEESDPARFMAAFTAGVAAGGPVFLVDPAWTPTQRAELAAALQVAKEKPFDAHVPGWLMIPSGGTGGRVKFARHDEMTLGAAVRGFCAHFDCTRVNAVGVLPLHHVSGLMAWMRCVFTGGTYLPWDWKRLEAGELPQLSEGPWVISLVPTQLQRLVGSPAAVEWLARFDAIFVGGGPIWPALADVAAKGGLRVSLSYGMTETAAMVAALRPVEFLAGARSVGAALPHVQLGIDAADGVVTVGGDSVYRGYWPEWSESRVFRTEDLGAFDALGQLQLLGRRDAVIITGGKKVQPADVEAALRASGQFTDVAVIGMPDEEWGEVVVACYPATNAPPLDFSRAVESLPAYQRPKRFVAITDWPRNAQGKVNRGALIKAVGAKL